MLAAVAGGEDGEALVAVLEAVAVRAGVRAGSPHVGEAGDVGELVEHPCGQEHRPRHLARPAHVTRTPPSSTSASWTSSGRDLDAVARQLGAAAGAQLRGVQSVVAQHAVHLVGRVVARRAVVEDQDAPARAAEHERGVETGRSRADDDAVPGRARGFGRRAHS